MNINHRPSQISAEFKAELERELVHLRADVRPAISERLQSAREGGDLTDNTAFEQAKEDLARLMVRVAEIEQTLREATIITHNGNGKPKSVAVGTIVCVSRDDGRDCTYKIVESWKRLPPTARCRIDHPLVKRLWVASAGTRWLSRLLHEPFHTLLRTSNSSSKAICDRARRRSPISRA